MKRGPVMPLPKVSPRELPEWPLLANRALVREASEKLKGSLPKKGGKG